MAGLTAYTGQKNGQDSKVKQMAQVSFLPGHFSFPNSIFS